jgi:hypothetical protein
MTQSSYFDWEHTSGTLAYVVSTHVKANAHTTCLLSWRRQLCPTVDAGAGICVTVDAAAHVSASVNNVALGRKGVCEKHHTICFNRQSDYDAFMRIDVAIQIPA